MNAVTFLRMICVTVGLTASLVPYFATLMGAPNIVLIVSDDQGYRDLGCFGGAEVQTPHLDRLASEGVRLTSFYVAWPACTPSRGSLLTGRYPQRNGLFDMIRNEAPDYGHRYGPAEYAATWERIGGMDEREILLPAVLKPADYRSGIFGKWDLGSLRRFLPMQRGFDDFYGFVNTGIDYYTHERYGVASMYRGNDPTSEDRGIYATDLFRKEALRFLGAHRAGPFFLYLPFNAPHSASNLDPRIRGAAQGPPRWKDRYPDLLPHDDEFQEGVRYGESATIPTRGKKRLEYAAAVSAMDEAIGSVLDALDSFELSRNTLVIFLSDNGGGTGADNSPLRGGKAQLFEGGIRVPCIVRWPGRIPAGSVCDEFLTALEIFPTALAAAGIEFDSAILDGFDMLPVLAGAMPSPRTTMFWERRDDRAARVGLWKWVESGKGNGLFDLAADIGERRDLSQERPDTLAMVRDRFEAWKRGMNQASPRGPFRDY